MYKKIVYCLLVLVFAVGLAGCGNNISDEEKDTSLQDVLKKGSIVVGVNDDMPPLSFIGRDEKINGFHVELFQEIGNRLDIELQIEIITEENEVNGENIDVLCGDAVSEKLKDKVDYSKTLDKKVLYVLRKDSDINISTINGLKIGISENLFNQLDNENNELFSNNEVLTFASEQEAMMQLGLGKVHLVLMDQWLAKYIDFQRPSEFKWLDEKIDQGSYGITFKKHNISLKEEIDRIIGEMKQDGFLDSLLRKWFGKSNIVE